MAGASWESPPIHVGRETLYHYEIHDQLRAHLADFVNAYNVAKHLKTLRGLTVFEFI